MGAYFSIIIDWRDYYYYNAWVGALMNIIFELRYNYCGGTPVGVDIVRVWVLFSTKWGLDMILLMSYRTLYYCGSKQCLVMVYWDLWKIELIWYHRWIDLLYDIVLVMGMHTHFIYRYTWNWCLRQTPIFNENKYLYKTYD